MKRMFVIYGQVNSGKTHTMWLVLNHLLEAGAELEVEAMHGEVFSKEYVLTHLEQIRDFRAIITKGNKRIAVWSASDHLNHYYDGFIQSMEWAVSAEVDYIVCTSRSRNREGSVYQYLNLHYKDDINWWEIVVKKCTENWPVECDEQAQLIVQRLLETIG